MKSGFRNFKKLFPLLIVGCASWVFLSCPSDPNTPLPGDPDYIPPDWTDPVLNYAEAAYFPVEVTDFRQAPGQYANDTTFQISGNEDLILGTPVGAGTAQAGNSSIVSPGIAGGYLVVTFDPPIENHPDNIGGYDFIVFGNSIWPGGDPASAWQEPGTVWIMKDENSNGNPDDTWYLIPGSHLSAADTAQTMTYNDTDPEISAGWWPAGEPSPMILPSPGYPDIFVLPDELYNTGGTGELAWGYGDVTPTMLLGDLTGADGSAGDNTIEDGEDYPGIKAVFFYTTPDTHGDRKIDPGSGGGDAIDISWAVNPADFSAAGLDEASWIMIVSATEKTGSVGEFSCEIDAVTRVRRNN